MLRGVRKLETRRRGIIRSFHIVAFIGALLVLVGYSAYRSRTHERVEEPEIQRIREAPTNTQKTVHFRKLITRIGPVAAQEALVASGMPATGETHLLVHEVGEYLYDTFGAAGLVHCREYFLSACYHAFLIETVAEKGLSGMIEALEHCAREGVNTKIQCSHAVGHGLVAWKDYALDDALALCDVLAKETPDLVRFNCYDGAFMENIYGVHTGVPSPKRWVKQQDSYFPCNSPILTPVQGIACWSNQPLLLFQRTNGDIAKVAEVCESLKVSDNRTMCFNGLSRQIHPLADGSVDKTVELCGQLPTRWSGYCISAVASAAYTVGDRSMPFALCKQLDGEEKKECSEGLFPLIASVSQIGTPERVNLCSHMEETLHRACQEYILDVFNTEAP